LALTAVLAVSAFLLGKSLTSVSARTTDTDREFRSQDPKVYTKCLSTTCGSREGFQYEILTCQSHEGGNDNCSTGSPAVYDYKNGTCPTNYHWQNSGNWDERCNRNNDASHTLPEHTSPTGCPTGYESGDWGCRKLITPAVPADPKQSTTPHACTVAPEDVKVCDPAGTCPTACGQEASRVPDGNGGYISCDATPACVVTSPSCTGDQHLDASGQNCVNWSPSGPAPRNDEGNGQVLGASTTSGQVLGASTMAGTGSFAEDIYMAIMTLGGTLSAFGIKNFKKASK